MDKVEHGLRLKAAMGRRNLSRTDVADYMDVRERTVTNWTSGRTKPTEGEIQRLTDLLGPYAADGDPVELAVRSSRLVEWRQDTVIGFYKRNLHEQGEERAG